MTTHPRPAVDADTVTVLLLASDGAGYITGQ
jgi:hypothetical protein